MIEGPFQRILAAAVQLFLVCPDYSHGCRQSIQTFADAINTARCYVLAGCPHSLDFKKFPMPASTGSSLELPFCGMKTLVVHCGHRQIYRAVHAGLREMVALLQMLDHTAIHGAPDVLRDVLAFAEDVICVCIALQHKGGADLHAAARCKRDSRD